MRCGLLIDYEYCTGCHSCEVACSMEHDIPIRKWGNKLVEIGPWKIGEDKWQLTYIPIPTELCNLCRKRVAAGKQPACVQHCQAEVIKYGSIKELAEYMEVKPKAVLFAPI